MGNVLKKFKISLAYWLARRCSGMEESTWIPLFIYWPLYRLLFGTARSIFPYPPEWKTEIGFNSLELTLDFDYAISFDNPIEIDGR